MPTPHLSRRSRIVLSAAFLTLAASGTAACGEKEPQETDDYRFYCTDASGKVVDEGACDNDGGGGNGGGGLFFVMISSSDTTNYPVGSTIPASVGARKISASDPAARKSWGLPANGRVTNGMTKTGIVGKGGGAPVGKAGGGAPGVSGAKGSSSGG